eukprot:364347-Chlamydomonas_euryale.AAC.17
MLLSRRSILAQPPAIRTPPNVSTHHHHHHHHHSSRCSSWSSAAHGKERDTRGRMGLFGLFGSKAPPAAAPPTTTGDADKPKPKKICCACPDTKVRPPRVPWCAAAHGIVGSGAVLSRAAERLDRDGLPRFLSGCLFGW